jgi:hypothetical protein
LIYAGVAASEGDRNSALEILGTAIGVLDGAGMHAYATAARFRRGQLIGGEQGRAETESAAGSMRTKGVKRPDRMVDLLAPGFAKLAART